MSKQRYISVYTPWGTDTIMLSNRKRRKHMQRVLSHHNNDGVGMLHSARLKPFYAFVTWYGKDDLDSLMAAIRKREWRTRVRRAPQNTPQNTPQNYCIYSGAL